MANEDSLKTHTRVAEQHRARVFKSNFEVLCSTPIHTSVGNSSHPVWNKPVAVLPLGNLQPLLRLDLGSYLRDVGIQGNFDGWLDYGTKDAIDLERIESAKLHASEM